MKLLTPSTSPLTPGRVTPDLEALVGAASGGCVLCEPGVRSLQSRMGLLGAGCEPRAAALAAEAPGVACELETASLPTPSPYPPFHLPFPSVWV